MADAEASQVADRRGARAGAMIQELQQLLGAQQPQPAQAPDIVPIPQPQAHRLIMLEQVSDCQVSFIPINFPRKYLF